jgi:hypothetical protein
MREFLDLIRFWATTHPSGNPSNPMHPLTFDLIDLLAEPRSFGDLMALTGLDYNTLRQRLDRLMLESVVRSSIDEVDGVIMLRYRRI